MKKVELPIIDIASLTSEDDRKRTVSDQLIEAFEEIGFAVLVGHGVEKKRLFGIRELLVRVFNVPDSVKEELSISRDNYRGYIPLGFFSPNEQKNFSAIKPISTKVSNCTGNALRNILLKMNAYFMVQTNGLAR